MGVITHTSQDKMSMTGVGARLLKVSLDALGQPAPAGACGRHICPSATGACGRTGVGGLGRACVGMRGHAWGHIRAKESVRCGVPVQLRWTRLRQTSPAIDDPASDHAERTTDASFSSGARRWSMRMSTWRGHTFISVLDQLE